MCIPDYESQARHAAKVLGYRLIRAEINADTTLYGWVEFAQWSSTLPDQFVGRQHWYEVRFKPLGKRWKDNWHPMSPSSDQQLNRLHFSVLERTAAHPEGATSVAKLGPIGHIRTEPKSVGLGTYLRDELIDWVASLHPNASVAKGSLSSVDGSADNLERRNRFYEGGKFQIRVQDDGSGAFWADRLDGLRRQKENGKVIELVKDDVHRLLQSVPELEKVMRQVTDLGDECKRLQTTKDKAQRHIFWHKVGAVALLVVLLFVTAQGKLSWHLF
jgi:hypothetical protein